MPGLELEPGRHEHLECATYCDAPGISLTKIGNTSYRSKLQRRQHQETMASGRLVLEAVVPLR